MEYPFKDLMPLDEVLEREGYYKDWTHLDPEVFYSLTQISEYIKTKGYGVDVRLLIAQLAEHFGLKTTQVVDLANLLSTKHDALKDQFDVVIRDATSGADWGGEIVLARGGKPTLQARLDETTAQLAQKADEADVFLKSNGVNINDFDEPTRQTFLNAQGINVNYVLGEGNVKPQNTTFFNTGKNLFNKNTVLDGMYLRSTTGVPDVVSEDYYTSDFIPILPNTTYYTFGSEQVIVYDIDKDFISTVTKPTFTSPSNAYYFRFSGTNAGLNTAQLEVGSTKTTYEPYKLNFDASTIKDESINGSKLKDKSVTEEKINDKAVTPSKLSDYEKGKNLFDKSTVTTGKFINQNLGTLSNNADYNASDWIEISANTTYTLKYPQYTAFYDANKNYISGFAENQPRTFTTPTNAVYMRTSAKMSQLALQQVELGSISTYYEPYGYRFKQQLLPDKYLYSDNNFKGLNLCVYGDSITAPSIWANDVFNAFSFGKLLNMGWSDSAVTLEDKTLYINSDGTYNSNPYSGDPENPNPQPSGTTEVQSSFCHADRIAYIPTDTDVVLIMGGTNDFLRHHPIGDTSYPYDETTFMGALCSAHKKIQEKLPNALIVMMTPIINPEAQGNPNPRVNYDGVTISEYVKAVREVTDYLGSPLIDVHRNSGINLHNTNQTLSTDGTHPVTEGHKLISRAVIGGLKTIIPVS